MIYNKIDIRINSILDNRMEDMNEIDRLKCELLVEKTKNNIYKQIINQKLGIIFNEEEKSEQTIQNSLVKLLEFLKILCNETTPLASVSTSKMSATQLKNDQAESPIKSKGIKYRSIGKKIIDSIDTNIQNDVDCIIINETTRDTDDKNDNDLEYSQMNNITECKKIIDDNFELIKTNRQYKKFIDVIKNERNKLMSVLVYSEYIEIIKEHISILSSILVDKKYDSKKIKSTLDSLLTPLEMRLIFFGTYTQTYLDIDDIQKFNDSLIKHIHNNVQSKKEYTTYNLLSIRTYFNTYICAISPIKNIIKSFLLNKYGYNNIIYLKLPKSESDDPYSFYILDKIVDGTKCWKMDCRLEDMTNELICLVRPYMISLFRKIYYDIFHDNNYRLDYISQSKSQITECECQQLLQNICYMIDQVNFMNDLRMLIRDNSTYSPTKHDKFNLHGYDNMQKKRLKNQMITDETIISVIRGLFDDITSADALFIYRGTICKIKN